MHSFTLKCAASFALVGLMLAGLLFSTTPARASGLTEVQIQAILSLISSFGVDSATIANVNATLHGQATGGSSGASNPSCLTLSYNLYTGLTDSTTNGQVTQLQQFLSVSPTGYFGPMTQQAVQDWQSSHGVVSSGSPDTTGFGFVGPATRTAMGCGGSGGGGNTNTNVSFTVTPPSGTAPLAITFMMQGGKTGSAYTIVPGNGTPNIGIIPGQSVTYTYPNAGTFTALLKENVGGQGTSYLQVGTATIIVTNKTTQQTLTATPTYGTAPLTVTFTSLTAGGTGYAINFGDGNKDGFQSGMTWMYSSPGTYVAQLLKCATASGCASYDVIGTDTVTVTAPSSNNSSDVFSCNPSPQTAKTIPLLMLCGGYGLSVNSTYSIDFGDGSSSGTLTLSAPGHAFGPDGPTNKMASADHTYVSPGTYTITFYKNSVRIGSTVIIAVVPTMVRIFPTNGKDSPGVSVRSEYASFVKMQILSEMPTAVPGLGYFGPVTTPTGATWIKYGGGSNGCSTYNYYQVMTPSPQTVLVSFTTCSPEYMPMDEHLRVLDTIAFG